MPVLIPRGEASMQTISCEDGEPLERCGLPRRGAHWVCRGASASDQSEKALKSVRISSATCDVSEMVWATSSRSSSR